MNPIFQAKLTDLDIVAAYTKAKDQIRHTDAPTEKELVLIREHLPSEPIELISLHWLRNRIVYLRKASKLPKQS